MRIRGTSKDIVPTVANPDIVVKGLSSVLSSNSFHDSLEDLNAMILAADPSNTARVTQLGQRLDEIVRDMEPNAPPTKLLSLGISGLRSIEKLERPKTLDAVASAVAASSEYLVGAEHRSLATLETAAAALRELLGLPEPQPPAATHAAPKARLSSDDEAVGELQGSILPWDRDLLIEFRGEARDRLAIAEAGILSLESQTDNAESINAVLRAFHTIKGSSGMLRLTHIHALAHQVENLLILCRDHTIRMEGQYADLALQACDALKFMLDQIEMLSPGEEPAPPDNIDRLIEALANVQQPLEQPAVVARVEPEPTTSVNEEDEEETDQAPAETPETDMVSSSRATSSLSETTIRVNTDRLDDLVNLVGELVIAQSIVAQDVNAIDGEHNCLVRSVSRAGKIIRQLQDLAMGLRMVPLKGSFQKMARLVRDLSHKSGKPIALETVGEDTEIDRNMVEILNDPLVHLIRNAVDHGIEPVSDRVVRGKEPTGLLHLRAYHAAGNVVIELEDDGRGLDRDGILRNAVQRGLVEANQELSDDDVYSLIFHPGLSTADQVTEVSGRGVGMDIVKRNVESLRGYVEVASRPGLGTQFTIRLPLTLGILDAMLLRVGRHQYLLPTIAIRRNFRPEPDSVSLVAGHAEMVSLHGQLFPLFRLHALFDIDDAIIAPEQAMVVVIEVAGKRCALLVDELRGQQQVVIKSLGKALANVQGVAGGAILGDGRVGIILDPVGLVQLAHGQTSDARTVSSLEQPVTQPDFVTNPMGT